MTKSKRSVVQLSVIQLRYFGYDSVYDFDVFALAQRHLGKKGVEVQRTFDEQLREQTLTLRFADQAQAWTLLEALSSNCVPSPVELRWTPRPGVEDIIFNVE